MEINMFDFDNDELIELDTDDNGFVTTQDDLVQIKIWKFISDSLELIGTITFHYHFDDHIFKGIVNKKNSSMILDTWYKTGISDFIVEKINDDWYVDFLGIKYVFNPDLLSDYYQFKKDYPEYRQLKLE
jgi:hypothetical protein